MSDLEALQAITGLGLLAHHIQHGIDEFCALRVMAFRPVVASTRLAEDEVVGAEELAIRTSTNGVHRARLQIHQNGARDVSAAGRFIEIDIDALQLQIRITMIGASWVNAMLIRNHFPKLGTNLVATAHKKNKREKAERQWMRNRQKKVISIKKPGKKGRKNEKIWKMTQTGTTFEEQMETKKNQKENRNENKKKRDQRAQ